MNKIIITAAGLWLGIVGGVSSGAAAELKMTYNSDWPPYSEGVGDKVSGILPELMTEIVENRMGIKVSHHGYPWKRVQRAVELGKLDAMVTVPTKARLDYAESSKSIVYTIQMHPIVVRGSSTETKINASPTPATLRSLKVCDIIGNGWGKRFAATNEIAPIMATKVSNCLRMIAKGRVDVSIQSLAVATRQIGAEKLDDELAILPIPYGQMKFTLLVSKQSKLEPGFMEEFDKTLNEMIEDGSYDALVKRLQMGEEPAQ